MSSIVKNRMGVIQVFCRNCRSLLVTTQASCWSQNNFDTIQKKCFSCHLDSPVTVMVKNIDSIRSFAGGPYKIFTEIESKYHIKTTTFISDEYKLFKAAYQVNLDASLLHCKVEKDCFNDSKISYLT